MSSWLFALALLSDRDMPDAGDHDAGNKQRFIDREAQLSRLEAEVAQLRAAERDAPGSR